MRTLALLVLTLLALALAACDSAPPTAGIVASRRVRRSPHTDAGSHCHAHLHTYAGPDRNPNVDGNPNANRDANGKHRTVAHAQSHNRTPGGADLVRNGSGSAGRPL